MFHHINTTNNEEMQEHNKLAWQYHSKNFISFPITLLIRKMVCAILFFVQIYPMYSFAQYLTLILFSLHQINSFIMFCNIRPSKTLSYFLPFDLKYTPQKIELKRERRKWAGIVDYHITILSGQFYGKFKDSPIKKKMF